ncbi:MAG: ABC transporter substrate-binding protein [Inquilinus sp.]|nr:ABC transporter substrate-binding protein [Inquilinus sp.]
MVSLPRRFGGPALIVASAATLLAAGPAAAQEVKIGALFGVTGPIANFVPPIIDSAQLAVDQVNEGGGILDGRQMRLVVGDTQGVAQGSVDAATKLVNVDGVTVVVGALTSGAAIAAANSVTIPSGVLQISPTATSPEMTRLRDNDFVFRVVPSDDYQGVILAKLVLDQGLERIALTYANNDYGVGIADTFRAAYTAAGGIITGDQVHEEKKNSYRSELATLSSGDPQALVLIAYAADSGITIIRQSLENGFFDRFVGTDGLRDNLLIEQIGADNLGDIFFTSPSSPPGTDAGARFEAAYSGAYETTDDKFFIAQTYDATMLAALAIQKAGTTDRAAVRDALRFVANPPGVTILPGDWAKARELLAAGQDIDYAGASGSHDFDADGDVAGVIGHFIVENGAYKEVGIVQP